MYEFSLKKHLAFSSIPAPNKYSVNWGKRGINLLKYLSGLPIQVLTMFEAP
jgi:hypothetical protein